MVSQPSGSVLQLAPPVLNDALCFQVESVSIAGALLATVDAVAAAFVG